MAKAIGIDLGTTNSVVAFKDTSVRTITTGPDNEELCRSCVAIDKKTGEFVVGNSPYNSWKKYAPNIVVSVKRLMGASISDEQVQKMKAQKSLYPYGIDKLAGGTDESVAVILNGKQYTPEQISAQILRQLKEDASVKLGEITHAVITVPAYFNEKQKTATRKAAELAGLKVQRLLAEPTAAAISYGVDKMGKDEEKVFLVYDFGGGTFDLSILVASGGNFIESGTGGDRWLGGDDIDKALMNYVFEQTNKEQNVDVQALIDALDDRKRFAFQGELKKQIESAKKQLSNSKAASIEIFGELETEDGDIVDIEVGITRDEFENLIRPLIQRTINLVDELLDKTGYPIETIDNILLVGGSSCIPLVKNMLVAKYGEDKILSSEKPMLAIAEGAAILAHSLSDEFECPECGEMVPKECTICPHCGAKLDKMSDDAGAEEPPIMVTYTTKHNYYIKLESGNQKIIDANELLPFEVNKKFKTSVDNQKIVELVILSDAEGGTFEKIASGFFTISDNLPIDSSLTFTFSLTESEELSAKVKIDKSGKTTNIVLGRGNKDSKCLSAISDSIKGILSDSSICDNKKAEYMSKVQESIEEISKNNFKEDANEWQDIENKINLAQNNAHAPEEADNSVSLVIAKILLGTFDRFIATDDESEIKSLISKAESSSNPMEKVVSLKKLENLTEKYSLFTTIFMFKLVAMSDSAVPAIAAQADKAYNDMMNALNRHDVDTVRNLISYNSNVLNSMSGGIDIKTALRG
ncbi:Hsp70 family protein [Prevotellamassilia timonensis]|uniref:Hsp70 family protein n=1 Tax=Prevotellamassilia timonensis TaxID=1852370 RepID=UPI00307A0D89